MPDRPPFITLKRAPHQAPRPQPPLPYLTAFTYAIVAGLGLNMGWRFIDYAALIVLLFLATPHEQAPLPTIDAPSDPPPPQLRYLPAPDSDSAPKLQEARHVL